MSVDLREWERVIAQFDDVQFASLMALLERMKKTRGRNAAVTYTTGTRLITADTVRPRKYALQTGEFQKWAGRRLVVKMDDPVLGTLRIRPESVRKI